ncbi:MAG: hypothetical protein RL662_1002 [Bacteroidota bacterium]|jgi:hypothetical protein
MNKHIDQADLSKIVAEQKGADQYIVNRFIQQLFNGIEKELLTNSSIKLDELGTFKIIKSGTSHRILFLGNSLRKSVASVAIPSDRIPSTTTITPKEEIVDPTVPENITLPEASIEDIVVKVDAPVVEENIQTKTISPPSEPNKTESEAEKITEEKSILNTVASPEAMVVEEIIPIQETIVPPKVEETVTTTTQEVVVENSSPAPKPAVEEKPVAEKTVVSEKPEVEEKRVEKQPVAEKTVASEKPVPAPKPAVEEKRVETQPVAEKTVTSEKPAPAPKPAVEEKRVEKQPVAEKTVASEKPAPAPKPAVEEKRVEKQPVAEKTVASEKPAPAPKPAVEEKHVEKSSNNKTAGETLARQDRRDTDLQERWQEAELAHKKKSSTTKTVLEILIVLLVVALSYLVYENYIKQDEIVRGKDNYTELENNDKKTYSCIVIINSDTPLKEIAKMYYGKEEFWPYIYKGNENIVDPLTLKIQARSIVKIPKLTVDLVSFNKNELNKDAKALEIEIMKRLNRK